MQHRVSSTVTSRLHDEMDRGDSSDVCSIFVAQRSCTTVAVQLTSSRVRLGQSFKTVGYGSASCWGDVGPEV